MRPRSLACLTQRDAPLNAVERNASIESPIMNQILAEPVSGYNNDL